MLDEQTFIRYKFAFDEQVKYLSTSWGQVPKVLDHNNSGQSVTSVYHFYKILLCQMLRHDLMFGPQCTTTRTHIMQLKKEKLNKNAL